MNPTTAPSSVGASGNRDEAARLAVPSPGVGARAALALIRGYKLAISPYFRGSCRFLPSCADYTAEAIRTHGLMRGAWLGARRLARCHPLCSAGYDPVPGRR